MTYMSACTYTRVMYMQVHRKTAVWRKQPIILDLLGGWTLHTRDYMLISPPNLQIRSFSSGNFRRSSGNSTDSPCLSFPGLAPS